MSLGLSQEQIPICLTVKLLVAVSNISKITPTECSVVPQQQIKKNRKLEAFNCPLNNAIRAFLLAPLFLPWTFLLQAW